MGLTLHFVQRLAKFGSSMKTYLSWAYFVLPHAVWCSLCVFLFLGNVYRGNIPAFGVSPGYLIIFLPFFPFPP